MAILALLVVRWAGGARAAQSADDTIEYPRLLAFRTGMAMKTEKDYVQYALFDFVHAGGERTLIHKYSPTAPVVAHWRQGVAYIPGAKKPKEFDIKYEITPGMWPGFWLLYNGTKLNGDVAADASATTIRVENTGVFQDPSESPKAFGPDNIQIYALDEQGKPVWEQSEQVVLQSIDPKAKTIAVLRGQFQSKPLAFKAGRAVAAAHARPQFHFGPDPHLWRLNFTFHCPRNPAGQTAAEYVGRFMGESLLRADLDGAEFDVGEWRLASATVTENRSYDADNDLRADECRFRHRGLGIINEHGLGQVVSIREMRKAAGAGKIIQTDLQMRAYPYLNGNEEEFYPCNQRQDPRGAAFQYDSLLYSLSRCAFEPKISYCMGKFPTATYNNEPDQEWSDRWMRMGLTSALTAGAYYTYNSVSTLKGGKGEVGLGFGRFYPWDEYDGGALRKKHYLGKALGPARPLEGQTGKESVAGLESSTLRSRSGFQAKSNYDGAAGVMRVEIVEQPDKPYNGGVVLLLPFRKGVETSEGAPFTLVGEVRADSVYGRIDPSLKDVPLQFGCNLEKPMKDTNRNSLLADRQWRSFSVALYAGAEAEGLYLQMGEEPGAFEFRGLKLLPGNGFVLYRLFENGAALMNGSDKPVVFDLGKIDPARKYQAIEGTITPRINDGRPIEGPVTVEPFDGRVLLTR